MKAIVREEYGSPDVLELKEIEKPVPGDGEVLVKVHAASVNTADLDYLRGRPAAARVASGISRPRSDRIGLDVAGRVEAVGRDVTTLGVGDDVWADLFDFGQGAFAEYVCAPEEGVHTDAVGRDVRAGGNGSSLRASWPCRVSSARERSTRERRS